MSTAKSRRDNRDTTKGRSSAGNDRRSGPAAGSSRDGQAGRRGGRPHHRALPPAVVGRFRSDVDALSGPLCDVVADVVRSPVEVAGSAAYVASVLIDTDDWTAAAARWAAQGARLPLGPGGRGVA